MWDLQLKTSLLNLRSGFLLIGYGPNTGGNLTAEGGIPI